MPDRQSSTAQPPQNMSMVSGWPLLGGCNKRDNCSWLVGNPIFVITMRWEQYDSPSAIDSALWYRQDRTFTLHQIYQCLLEQICSSHQHMFTSIIRTRLNSYFSQYHIHIGDSWMDVPNLCFSIFGLKECNYRINNIHLSTTGKLFILLPNCVIVEVPVCEKLICSMLCFLRM